VSLLDLKAQFQAGALSEPAYIYRLNGIIALLADIGYRCFTVHKGRLVSFEAMNENNTKTIFFLHPDQYCHSLESLCAKDVAG